MYVFFDTEILHLKFQDQLKQSKGVVVDYMRLEGREVGFVLKIRYMDLQLLVGAQHPHDVATLGPLSRENDHNKILLM